MQVRKLVILILMFLVLCAFAAAQTQTSEAAAEKAKKKKEIDELVLQMLDQSAADAAGLRLPGNRAIVDAMTADLYWKKDEKRARELFRNAAGELVSYNAEAEKEAAESTDPNVKYNPYDQNDPRTPILNLVSRRDADFALELLYQTRSVKLSESMAKAAVAADQPMDLTNITATMDKARASQEVALEQQIAQLAANGDPEKLAKLIKDALAKGVSPNLLGLLQNLNAKDPKKAAELGAEVIAKAADADMAKNQSDLTVGLSFLQSTTRAAAMPPPKDPKDKPFQFDPAALKALANKIADALLVPSKSMMASVLITSALPTLEKYVPERIAALKARDAENKKSLPTEFKNMGQQQNLWNPATAPEEILAQLPKMTNENEKRSALTILASKIGQITDEARAKKLIDQIPDDKIRATAQEQFDAGKVGRAIAAGKVDEARRLIGTMTNRRMQIPLLVNLAMQSQKKGTEKDTEAAKSIMTDAKALVREYVEDEDDLADLMEIIRGYAAVDSEVAFRMFEPMVDEFNNFIQASAVLSKYNKRSGVFKKGEMILRMNGGMGNGVLPFRYIPQMQLLGKADIEHMSHLADRFQRSDARALVRLYVLQGFMTEDRRPNAPGGTGGIGTGISTVPAVIRP